MFRQQIAASFACSIPQTGAGFFSEGRYHRFTGLVSLDVSSDEQSGISYLTASAHETPQWRI